MLWPFSTANPKKRGSEIIPFFFCFGISKLPVKTPILTYKGGEVFLATPHLAFPSRSSIHHKAIPHFVVDLLPCGWPSKGYMRYLPSNVVEQIRTAYRKMVAKARYRPAAPSDGFGNLTIDQNEAITDKEMTSYAQRWWEQEDNFRFFIGCCDMRTRSATIFAIEAAKNMCGGTFGNGTALRLLRMAVKELEQAMKQIDEFPVT